MRATPPLAAPLTCLPLSLALAPPTCMQALLCYLGPPSHVLWNIKLPLFFCMLVSCSAAQASACVIASSGAAWVLYRAGSCEQRGAPPPCPAPPPPRWRRSPSCGRTCGPAPAPTCPPSTRRAACCAPGGAPPLSSRWSSACASPVATTDGGLAAAALNRCRDAPPRRRAFIFLSCPKTAVGGVFTGQHQLWRAAASLPWRAAAAPLLTPYAAPRCQTSPPIPSASCRWVARCSFGGTVECATRLVIQATSYFRDPQLVVRRAWLPPFLPPWAPPPSPSADCSAPPQLRP